MSVCFLAKGRLIHPLIFENSTATVLERITFTRAKTTDNDDITAVSHVAEIGTNYEGQKEKFEALVSP